MIGYGRMPLPARACEPVRCCLCGLLLLLIGCLAGCGGGEQQQQAAGPPEKRGELFTDVTAEAGLGGFRHETGAVGKKWFPEAMGSGGAFIDYDGDGWLDVLLAGGGTWPGTGKKAVPALWLYRNDGDGTFTLRTQEAGLDGVDAYSNGFAVADYDNDGDQDFYLTTLTTNRLFRNDAGSGSGTGPGSSLSPRRRGSGQAPGSGAGRFVEVGREAGVAGDPAWSTSALFFDADRDGHLDLYVGGYVDWTPETDLVCTLFGGQKDYCTPQTYTGLPGRFYHSNGDGTFSDWTEAAGFRPAPGKTLGVAELDVNRDGWPDLVVANDTEPDQLYVNDGGGTFTDRGAVSGIAYDDKGRTRAGMGVDAGVVDSTGEVTVFVGNFSREMIGVYRHQRGGLFLDRAAVSKVGRPSLLTLTFGLFLFDADLDGDLDLFAANGHVQPDIEKVLESVRYAEPAHLFLNRGGGTFEDVAPEASGALQQALVARGAMYGDYDRDGDLDILLTENGRGARLWRNNLNRASYLRVHAEGRESNRSALGTRLVASTGGLRMEQRLRGGSSYLSASEQVATFGLGAHPQVESLVVYWPSGRVDRFGPLDGGQDVLVVEGGGPPVPL